MNNIKLYNKISQVGLDVFDNTKYNVSENADPADGILVRSAALHEVEFNKELLAIARAGAGVNNIPIDRCSEQGIVVFNTPGANANAVNELVITALLLGSRKIADSLAWVNTLKGQGVNVAKLVEKGKNQFVGGEVLGKKLGIIGLGAIGAKVADAAIGLGMQVIGYDPFLSVNSALRLSRQVKVVSELDEIYKDCDYITLHLPYIADKNKDFINGGNIRKMKDGVVIINCARGELVNNDDIIKAVNSGKVSRYVVDFPTDELIGVNNIVCLPHLGASTPEAEENCAVMASKQLIDYIENGNINNSVNYPNCSMPKTSDLRLVILHKNVAGMLAQITGKVGSEGINITHLSNQSRGDYAVTMIDVNSQISNEALSHISSIPNIIKVRVIK